MSSPLARVVPPFSVVSPRSSVVSPYVVPPSVSSPLTRVVPPFSVVSPRRVGQHVVSPTSSPLARVVPPGVVPLLRGHHTQGGTTWGHHTLGRQQGTPHTGGTTGDTTHWGTTRDTTHRGDNRGHHTQGGQNGTQHRGTTGGTTCGVLCGVSVVAGQQEDDTGDTTRGKDRGTKCGVPYGVYLYWGTTGRGTMGGQPVVSLDWQTMGRQQGRFCKESESKTWMLSPLGGHSFDKCKIRITIKDTTVFDISLKVLALISNMFPSIKTSI